MEKAVIRNTLLIIAAMMLGMPMAASAAVAKPNMIVIMTDRKTYGRPRIHLALQAKDQKCGTHRLVRLMKEEAMQGVQKKRFRVQTTDSNHPYSVAPNLLKGRKKASRANEIWATDITYIRTDEGWTYRATVLDMFSRKIVGWAMSEKIDGELTAAALKNALHGRNAPEIHHSDRGKQYACRKYRKLLRGYGITASMSRKGNPYDNATMESFFGTMKAEEVKGQIYPSAQTARAQIFAYIEAFYNTSRIHTSLDGLSPCQYEDQSSTLENEDTTTALVKLTH